MPVPAQAND